MADPNFVTPGEPMRAAWANSVVSAIRGKRGVRPRGLRTVGGVPSSEPLCDFGSIITFKENPNDENEEEKTGIQGGTVICGDQTWFFSPYEVDPKNEGEWLVYLKVEVEVNQDDDHELLLPGVKTGTKPDIEKTAYNNGTNYPDGEAPTVGSGKGKIVLPIGLLTVDKDENVSLQQTGCGGFVIRHCAGSLSYSR